MRLKPSPGEYLRQEGGLGLAPPKPYGKVQQLVYEKSLVLPPPQRVLHTAPPELLIPLEGGADACGACGTLTPAVQG